MEIKVVRETRTKNSTIGKMFINDIFECFTLEDVEREEKIYGETAIPKGRYKVVMSFSNRFQQYMPEVLNVENFKGIRIHTGNKKEDTHGCILVGDSKGNDFIGLSKQAYARLLSKIKAVEKKEPIYLTIM